MGQEKKFNLWVSKGILTSHLTHSQTVNLITNTVKNKLYNKNGGYESAQVDYEVAKILKSLDIKTEDFRTDDFYLCYQDKYILMYDHEEITSAYTKQLTEQREEILSLRKYQTNFQEIYDTDYPTFADDEEEQKKLINEIRTHRMQKLIRAGVKTAFKAIFKITIFIAITSCVFISLNTLWKGLV